VINNISFFSITLKLATPKEKITFKPVAMPCCLFGDICYFYTSKR
jgi:hypothetical protein